MQTTHQTVSYENINSPCLIGKDNFCIRLYQTEILTHKYGHKEHSAKLYAKVFVRGSCNSYLCQIRQSIFLEISGFECIQKCSNQTAMRLRTSFFYQNQHVQLLSNLLGGDCNATKQPSIMGCHYFKHDPQLQ